jgi:hypothetical protein
MLGMRILWLWRLTSSGIWCCVVWYKLINASEELTDYYTCSTNGLIFHPKNEGSTFFRNACKVPDYTASHLWKYFSSVSRYITQLNSPPQIENICWDEGKYLYRWILCDWINALFSTPATGKHHTLRHTGLGNKLFWKMFRRKKGELTI